MEVCGPAIPILLIKFERGVLLLLFKLLSSKREKQTNKQQTDKQTERQTHRQTDKAFRLQLTKTQNGFERNKKNDLK